MSVSKIFVRTRKGHDSGWFRSVHFRSRRSQAAMELLMTYGWAILVVAAAIAALAYFGVMNPAKFFPESCTMPSTSGLGCMDFKMTPDAAYLMIMNGRGLDMHISNITVGECAASFDVDLLDGYSNVFNVTGCSFGSKGAKIREDLIIYYNYKDSNMSKPGKGSITAKIA
ncbi:hypothetical protein KY362_05220 [Candidatus Woesearchaeota archaeon]|nr:hypothetical protein [Candidatus Woesearchaeota archaeon]